MVDLCNSERSAWHGGRGGVEALQPVANGVLDVSVVPEDVYPSCPLLALLLFPW